MYVYYRQWVLDKYNTLYRGETGSCETKCKQYSENKTNTIYIHTHTLVHIYNGIDTHTYIHTHTQVHFYSGTYIHKYIFIMDFLHSLTCLSRTCLSRNEENHTTISFLIFFIPWHVCQGHVCQGMKKIIWFSMKEIIWFSLHSLTCQLNMIFFIPWHVKEWRKSMSRNEENHSFVLIPWHVKEWRKSFICTEGFVSCPYFFPQYCMPYRLSVGAGLFTNHFLIGNKHTWERGETQSATTPTQAHTEDLSTYKMEQENKKCSLSDAFRPFQKGKSRREGGIEPLSRQRPMDLKSIPRAIQDHPGKVARNKIFGKPGYRSRCLSHAKRALYHLS